MTSLKGLTLTEVAAVVAEHLKTQSIDVAIVGGSAITSHVPYVYTSQDIDFANPSEDSLRTLGEALKPVGFEKSGRVFMHPDTIYTVDFVADTPLIDARPIYNFVAIETNHGTVMVYSLEDAIADRVVAFLHWSDSESLDVAERTVIAARERLTWEGIDAVLQQLDYAERNTRLRFELARKRLKKAFDGR